MRERHHLDQPAEFRYAVGVGMGLLVGGVIGLFVEHFLVAAILGVAVGILLAYVVGRPRP